jgi:hypothetical protein
MEGIKNELSALLQSYDPISLLALRTPIRLLFYFHFGKSNQPKKAKYSFHHD